jgi:hypothetical protein
VIAKVAPVESELTNLALRLTGEAGGVDGTEGVDGAVITKLTAPDVPPPGAGVKTVTGTEPAPVRSDALIVAWSRVELANVVARAAPFQRTTDELTKPLPFTVRVNPELPAAVVDGERLLATGAGDEADRAGTERPLQAWSTLDTPVAPTDRTQT